MKCVICHVGELRNRTVEEEIRVGSDILLTAVEVEICDSCGERHYDRATMRRLEELEGAVRAHADRFPTVGRVLQHAA